MGWDGAGGYTRQHNFSADASAGIKILAARMDTELDDFASAMTIALTRNGQNVPTANLPMGGFRHINVGAPTSVNNYMRSREFIENVPIFMQDAESSADRISVSAQYFTSVSANQAPGDGTRIIVRANSTKASAVLYLNGHSANVEFQDGNAAVGVMVSGGVYELIFSSVDTAWKIQNPTDGRTAAERAAGVTPTNYQFDPGYQERYSTIADLFACGEKTLYLSDNTTTVITSALTVPSNTRVVGHGSNSVIKAGANISLLSLDGVSNVILEHFRLDGDRTTYTNSGNNGIYLPANGVGCTNVSIRNVDVVNTGGAGIIGLAQTGSHSSRITVDGCYVYNCGAHGIIFQDFVDSTFILNNHVEDFGMTVADRPGITTGRSAVRHRVIGNYVKGSSSALGTSVHGISMDNCNDFVCNDNLIENAIGFGIELGGAQEGTCNGNTVLDGDRACIEVGCNDAEARHITISGNVCTNGGDAGILLQKGSGTQVKNVVITGNHVNACAGIGIGLQDTCAEIVVVGNQVIDGVVSGIYCNVSNNAIIQGNLVKDCNTSNNASHAGIRVINTTSETDYVIDNNRVTGNGVLNYNIDNPIRRLGPNNEQNQVNAFTALDATPSVAVGMYFRTADTTTITDFDDGIAGQEIHVYVDHAVTFDCTGTDLKAAAGADITAVAGDMVIARTKDGTTWRVQHIDCTA